MADPRKLAQLFALPGVLAVLCVAIAPRNAGWQPEAFLVSPLAPLPAEQFFAAQKPPSIRIDSTAGVDSASLADPAAVSSAFPAGLEPVVDVTVEAADEASARRLAESLDNYLAAPAALFLRPPWHPKGVSPEQERARATLVAIERAVRLARSGPELARRLQRSLRRVRDPAEMRHRLEEVYRELTQKAIEEAAQRPDTDLVVVSEVRKTASSTLGWSVDPGLRARLAQRLGVAELEVVRESERGPAHLAPTVLEHVFGATGRVQLEGRKVSLGGVAFHRFARAFPALLAHLAATGCKGPLVELSHADVNARHVPHGNPFEDLDGE